MKNIRFLFTGVLAALLLATVAQAQETNVRAVVPFAFVIGDRAYPAGEYSLKSLSGDSPVILVNDIEGTQPNVVMSHGCQNTAPSADTKLVFHAMGGNYFLYQIWTEGRTSGREFTRSHTEKLLAQNHEPSDTVIVAANISH